MTKTMTAVEAIRMLAGMAHVPVIDMPLITDFVPIEYDVPDLEPADYLNTPACGCEGCLDDTLLIPPFFLKGTPEGIAKARDMVREGLMQLDLLCALDTGDRFILKDALDDAIKHALTTYAARVEHAEALNTFMEE